MIPELGHFALILALCVAVLQAFFPLAGSLRGASGWIAMSRPLAHTQFLFMAIAYGCLTYAFIYNDFSVLYVASNSNSELPLIYRISGVWGAHEGSLLLWALILSGWTMAVTLFSRSLPDEFVARVLGVMGLISIGFLLFIIATSNPFERLIPAALEGRDLNPLLQDPGLAIHPPMLYMGYVGFSVAFSFAIAALIGGQLDAAWARWSRPWTTISWMFLTLGIAIGSWWAYYELGWGGWWFWDPVENASFMPWLVGTALMHSLAATEKRGVFKTWTVLLALFAFALSLLGTFLVRSGVLTSVHAFATDPTRGVFILIFLVVVVGGSLGLYAWRAPKVRSSGKFQLLSRETALLLNNVLLVLAAASVLLGTLYPLFIDALGMGKISVGPPYFDTVFVPLMLPLVVLMGIGPIVRWKRHQAGSLFGLVRNSLLLSVLLGLAFIFYPVDEMPAMLIVTIIIALWVLFTSLKNVQMRIATRPGWIAGVRALPRSFAGMTLAHVGIAVFMLGVAVSGSYSVERDVRLSPGESSELAGYRFTLDYVAEKQGPNYSAHEGAIQIYREDEMVASLTPEKRIYQARGMPMTEAGIDAGFFRDVYAALGEPLGDGSWSVRLYVKPFIRWIWLGCLMMAAGGLLAASDRRYRLRKTAPASAALATAATQQAKA